MGRDFPDSEDIGATAPIDAGTDAPGAKQRPTEPPKCIGRYEVIDTIGQGGMGVVYLARDPALRREVALKVATIRRAGRREKARALREAQVLARLSHPNVVSVYDADLQGDALYIAMERIEGRDLARWLRTPRPWREVLDVFVRAGEGLAHAHREGLVHRDFKPHNVMLDGEGRVKVLDFGLARLVYGAATASEDEAVEIPKDPLTEDHTPASLATALTETGTAVGTPAYMPPEAAFGRPVDERSDQFSFCVALYEALYGTRPYPGRSAAEIQAAVRRGRAAPAKPGRTAPTALRRALLRGLSPKPRDRYPDMAALLADLRRVSRRGRMRRWGAAAVVGGVAVAALLVFRAEPDRCASADTYLGSVWNPARREAVESALLRDDLPFAARTWDGVDGTLDAYAGKWRDAYTMACEAGPQPALDRRMACLHSRLRELDALVGVLSEADRNVAAAAVGAVAKLAPVERCAASPATAVQTVPPPPPGIASQVEALRNRIAHAEALCDAGQYDAAAAALAPAVAQARTLDYPPLLAEALATLGDVLSALAHPTDAERALQEAYLMATASGHPSAAAKAARALVFVVGVTQARYDEGLSWGRHSQAQLERAPADPLGEAWLLGNLGSLYGEIGLLAESTEHHRRALELEEATLGPESVSVASTLNNVGNALNNEGKYAEAVQAHRRALGIWQRAAGPDHPGAAAAMVALGGATGRTGRPREAQELVQRGLEVTRRAHGDTHPAVAEAYETLATVETDLGRLEDAIGHLRQALEILETVYGPDAPQVAGVLGNLSGPLMDRGNHAEALTMLRRALRIVEETKGRGAAGSAQLHNNAGVALEGLGRLDESLREYRSGLEVFLRDHGEHHPLVPVLRGNVAMALHRSGRHGQAVAAYEVAIAAFEAERPQDPRVHDTRIGLGEVLVESGRPAAAVQPLQQALTHADESPEHARWPWARFTLARALWAADQDRRRAPDLARHALAAVHDDEELKAEIEAWLKTVGAPKRRR